MLVQLSSINSSHLLWPKLGFGHIYILSDEAVCMQLQVKWHSFGFTKVKVNPYITVMYTYLLSTTQLRQGNVFTRVCHSVHGGGADTNEVFEGYVLTRVCLSTGVSAPLHAGIHPPPWQTPLVSPYPPGRHPLAQCMLGYGQQAGGTHPTGMQSCVCIFFNIQKSSRIYLQIFVMEIDWKFLFISS